MYEGIPQIDSTQNTNEDVEEALEMPKHLKEGIRPIMASVGMSDQHQDESGKLQRLFRNETVDGVEDLFFAADPRNLTERGIVNGGDMTYIISKVDGLDKFSAGYFNCTGLVVVGRDRVTQEDISFVSHQDPESFLNGKQTQFLADLDAKLKEIKDRCEDGTIDAVIVGGNYLEKDNSLSGGHTGESAEEQLSPQDYERSIDLLRRRVADNLSFQPAVPVGPKLSEGCDSVYFDNKNRRIYIGWSEKDMSVYPGYNAGDINTEKMKWRNG